MRSFRYHRAADTSEAVALVAGEPQSAFLAGGTNLVDPMKLGVQCFAWLRGGRVHARRVGAGRRGRPGAIHLVCGNGTAAHPPNVMTMPTPLRRRTIHDRLEDARSRYRRMRPAGAYRATRMGSLLIDTRDGEQLRRDGLVPGAVVIDRTVLEWRIDPESGATHPAITSLHLPLILLCNEGCSSSLAVASLLGLGATDVTDVEGGFEAWRAAGLPVAPYGTPGRS